MRPDRDHPGGKIVAHGTMAEVREQTASERTGLEDLFLKLTGGMRDRSWTRFSTLSA